jgi:hypothetical protein
MRRTKRAQGGDHGALQAVDLKGRKRVSPELPSVFARRRCHIPRVPIGAKEIVMSKKSQTPNDQRSTIKNPTSKEYAADRANRVAQNHPNPPAPPPPQGQAGKK